MNPGNNNNINSIQRESRKLQLMKQQTKKPNRDPIIMNIKKLAQNVVKAQSKNITKYNLIIELNPNFDFKLYKPTIPSYESRQELSLAEQIMMRQIDRLMEDEEKLNIEINRRQIKQKEQERKIEREIMYNMDHFTFLRKLWKKDEAKQRSDSKAEKLIHNVGAIKGHILNLIKRENNISESPPEIHELVISSPEYCQLSKKYEQLRLESEQRLLQEKQEITNTNNTSESSIESQDTRKQNQQLEAELARLKLELLNKNNEVERLKRLQANSHQKHNKDCQDICQEYKINSYDGCYEVSIKVFRKSLKEFPFSNPNISFQQNSRTIQCKHSLEEILKFLQGNEARKTSRTSIAKVRPGEPETRPKKFTVEQIARPKFISNRQISTTATNNTTQSQNK